MVVPAESRLDDEAVIVKTASARPEKQGRSFTHWSIRKLAAYDPGPPRHHLPSIGRERLRERPSRLLVITQGLLYNFLGGRWFDELYEDFVATYFNHTSTIDEIPDL